MLIVQPGPVCRVMVSVPARLTPSMMSISLIYCQDSWQRNAMWKMRNGHVEGKEFLPAARPVGSEEPICGPYTTD